MLAGKVVAVGITGGIAAYKAADLVSRLVKLGAEVHVMMTAAATKFVNPLTFRTLSQHPVMVDMFDEPGEWNVRHVALTQKANLFVIAPATANIIGKIANGIADDFLTTTVMAACCPVMLAPAMNVNMFQNPVLQANLQRLQDIGYRLIEPAEGRLACGDIGKGRLAEVEDILEAIKLVLLPRLDLLRRRVLVTAGATCEPLDPIRFITNHSTGRMGFAVAAAAQARGADVLLVSGPSTLQPPPGIRVIKINTALEMHAAVLEHFGAVDVVIKTAAVADYRPLDVAKHKIKKNGGNLVLELTRNPDILADLGALKEHQVLVGFAAETREVAAYAAEKVRRKNLDFIVANDVTMAGAGFGVETNIATFIFADGRVEEQPLMSKSELAHRILDQIAALWNH